MVNKDDYKKLAKDSYHKYFICFVLASLKHYNDGNIYRLKCRLSNNFS